MSFVHEFQLAGLDIDPLINNSSDYAGALKTLLEAIERHPDDGDQLRLWTKYFHAGPNLFLDWFRAANFPNLDQALQDSTTLPFRFQKLAGQFGRSVETTSGPDTDRLWPILNALSPHLAKASGDTSRILVEIRRCLDRAIQDWSGDWGVPSFESGSEISEEVMPAFAQWLRLASPPLFQIVGSIAVPDEEGATGCGWGHPALLMLLDLLHGLLKTTHSASVKEFAPVDFTAQTWALFAVDDPQAPRGVLGQLTVERIVNGGGFVFPDPRYHAHCRAKDGFFPAIQHAWQVVHRACAGNPNLKSCDYRWRLELRSSLPTDWHLAWSGRSATAAFAVALRAAATEEPIDLRCAVSAELNIPENKHATEILLGPVGSLREKQLSDLVGTNARALIAEIFVAATQNTPTEQRDDLKYLPLATFDELFERMAKFGRMTRDYREAIIERAADILKRQCSLELKDSEGQTRQMGSYVDPRLKWSFHSPHHEGAVTKKGQEDAPDKSKSEHELSEQAVSVVLQGSLPDLRFSAETEENVSSSPDHPGQRYRRAWIYADSGFGKSLLLVRAEQRIAHSPDLVPVRIGGPGRSDARLKSLSMFNELMGEFSDPFVALAIELHERQGFLPQSSQPTPSTKEKIEQAENPHLTSIVEWLQRLFRAGRLVLLLDALDQTENNKAVERLNRFVNQAVAAKNNVLLTGRKESRATRGLMFDKEGSGGPQDGVDVSWDLTLELEPFNEQQQNLVLGDFAEQVRQKAPAELLKVPLLLLMLRRLAAEGNLQPIRNRAELFEKVVADLIKQGLTSQKDLPEEKQFADDKDVIRKLRELAAAQIQECGSPNLQDLSADQFDAVRTYLKAHSWGADAQSVFETLAQVDLTTLGSLLEGFGKPDRTGLSWRMRSFLEYFTALALTNPKLESPEGDWIDDLFAQQRLKTMSS